VSDLAQLFIRRWQELGGYAQLAPTYAAAHNYLEQLLRERRIRLACGWDDPVLERASVPAVLARAGVQYRTPASGLTRDWCESSELGVTTADLAVAETATLAMSFGPPRPRSAGLLPPSWLAIVPLGRLAAGRTELLAWMARLSRAGTPPAQIGLCSGPSSTGDIEMTLLRGVHGPGDVHALLVEEER
jgi:L-lactate dehydrogenase complex protein LldG